MTGEISGAVRNLFIYGVPAVGGSVDETPAVLMALLNARKSKCLMAQSTQPQPPVSSGGKCSCDFLAARKERTHHVSDAIRIRYGIPPRIVADMFWSGQTNAVNFRSAIAAAVAYKES
jgi:hypothetical protein